MITPLIITIAFCAVGAFLIVREIKKPRACIWCGRLLNFAEERICGPCVASRAAAEREYCQRLNR